MIPAGQLPDDKQNKENKSGRHIKFSDKACPGISTSVLKAVKNQRDAQDKKQRADTVNSFIGKMTVRRNQYMLKNKQEQRNRHHNQKQPVPVKVIQDKAARRRSRYISQGNKGRIQAQRLAPLLRGKYPCYNSMVIRHYRAGPNGLNDSCSNQERKSPRNTAQQGACGKNNQPGLKDKDVSKNISKPAEDQNGRSGNDEKHSYYPADMYRIYTKFCRHNRQGICNNT